MNPEIDILVNEEGWLNALPECETLVRQALETTLSVLKASKPYEISVVLTDDSEIRQLNKQWRGKDKPTNVLSFPQDEDVVLGDIILSLQTIKAEAAEQSKPLPHHFSHLAVHGLLHLLGYDHENDAEAEEMENLEIKICTKLGIKNPYIDDDKSIKMMA